MTPEAQKGGKLPKRFSLRWWSVKNSSIYSVKGETFAYINIPQKMKSSNSDQIRRLQYLFKPKLDKIAQKVDKFWTFCIDKWLCSSDIWEMHEQSMFINYGFQCNQSTIHIWVNLRCSQYIEIYYI